MNSWDRETTDNARTEPIPRRLVVTSRGASPQLIGVLAAAIVVVLATPIVGYFGLNWFHPNQSGVIALAPTATSTTGLAPSLPTATTRPTVPPTPKPKPTPIPSPAILRVTPTFIADASTDCAIEPGYRICTFRLSNRSSTTPLRWTGSASSLGVNVNYALNPKSGTISPGRTATVTFTDSQNDCGIGVSDYIKFTGPHNAVTVTVDCQPKA